MLCCSKTAFQVISVVCNFELRRLGDMFVCFYHLEVSHSLIPVFKSLTSKTRNRRNKSNCNTVPLLFTLTHSSMVNCKRCSREPIFY